MNALSQTSHLAPIAIFAFNRPEHLLRVLNSLSKCRLIESSDVIIFIDGARNSSDDTSSVEEVARSFNSSKSLEVVVREHNLGLAQSIVSGVSSIVNKYSKIIVLEDDIVVSPAFLEYMNGSLNHFENDLRVGSIHGYLYPLPKRLDSPFFIRGADCWGWGTWKRAWDKFESNGLVLKEKILKQNLINRFNHNDSYDYMDMLQKQIDGSNNSWAIRWHASMFLENMLCLYPDQTLVENIGIDGSGTHCKVGGDFSSELRLNAPDTSSVKVEESLVANKLFEKYFLSQKTLQGRIKFCLRKMTNLKSFIKAIVPKAMLRLKNRSSEVVWEKTKLSYKQVLEKYKGYDDPLIFNKVENSARGVVSGKYSYERDGIGFREECTNEKLEYFLNSNFKTDDTIRIVDFGGSLASTFLQNRKSLKKFDKLSWTVVEQASFVEKGISLFSSEQQLSFSSELPLEFDVLFCSSTLQYVETPFELLETIVSRNPKFIIFDRLSVINENDDVLTIQYVPQKIYKATYPCWFLSQKKINQALSTKYELKYLDWSSLPLEVDLCETRSQDLFEVWVRK